MSQLTPRQKEIYRILSRNSDAVAGRQLSDLLGVSLRTVQNEAAGLRDMGLIRSTANGYLLTDAAPQRLAELDRTAEPSSDSARLLHRLLLTPEPLGLGELADAFYLSETSLRSRLKELDAMLTDTSLRVCVQKDRVWLDGSELNKRRMIRDRIYYEISPGYANSNQYSRFFGELDVQRLRGMIVDSVKANNCFMQGSYAATLILNVVIALFRIEQGIHCPPEEQQTPPADGIEMCIAREICARCERHWGMPIEEADCNYIASLFYGQIFQQTGKNALPSSEAAFEACIANILTEAFEHYMLVIDFSEHIHSIAMHIRELIKRGRANNYVINNMHVNIRDYSPFIYDVAVFIAQRLDHEFDIHIPDDEIGFLSVYVGVVVENAIQETDRVRTLIISSGYQNIAGKISDRLSGTYGAVLEIITQPHSSGEQLVGFVPDLIISTQPINVLGQEVVNISPFFGSMDQARVDTAINNCLKKKETRRNNNYLSSCFHEKLFFRDNTVLTRDDAIRFLGQKLIEFGVVEPDFIESVFQRENASSTCFFEKFAIPHSDKMNAHKTMIAVLINENGIQWQEHSIKLCLLFAISSKDRKMFSKVYSGAVHALCDDVKLGRLIRSQSLPEFISVMKQ